MRKLIAAAAVLAAVVPAASAGAKDAPHSTQANTACHQLRHDLGTATFRQTYGTNHNGANAMGRCRSAERRAEHADQTNAARACKAEQAADPAAFAAKYGHGKKGKGAFGACVSQKAKASAAKRHTATVNAAKACKSERAADPAAFKDKYGVGKNHANAFGKCVSTAVRSHKA